MSSTHYNSPIEAGQRYALPLEMLQGIFIWLLVAVSWVVAIEPAPYEFVFLVTLALFVPCGLRVSRQMAPLIVFLLLYNIGGLFALLPHLDSSKAARFITISWYMAATGVFFAFASANAPLRIIPIIRNAYIVAAIAASMCGLIGYFDIAGMAELWAPISRAQGTFKDPNVFGTYLILPAVFLVHGLATGTQRWRVLAVIAVVIILAGNFLAFSRGAWLAMFASITLSVGLTFMITPSMAVRSRIMIYAVSGIIVTVSLIAFALGFDEIREMFGERAKLIQSYDGGETGRFARQLNSIPLLFQSPNGLGPFVFGKIFGEDPHNVYLNAFFSYGWLGGLSYLLLIAATIAAGLRSVFTRTPWQPHAVVIFSVLTITILQGVQIDTDHWRHFYLELGLMWGLYAATENWLRSNPKKPATV